MLGIISATRAPFVQPMPCSHAPNAADSASSSAKRDRRPMHENAGRVANLRAALLEDLAHRRVFVDVDLGGYAGG